MALSFNDVNKRGSFTWVKCNDDSKSSYFRQIFCQKHGGNFIQQGRYWEWNPSVEQIIENINTLPPTEEPKIETTPPVKTFIFKNSNGKEVKTENISEFCKKYKLTRSCVYEVISGKRKQHKGYTFIGEVLN